MSSDREGAHYVSLEEVRRQTEQPASAEPFLKRSSMVKYLAVGAIACCCLLAAVIDPLGELGTADAPEPFNCETTTKFSDVIMGANKGIAIDDETFLNCMSALPEHWPNTDHPVLSLRLFASWKGKNITGRIPAYTALASYVWRHNAKVLVGMEISCNETKDEEDMEHVLELMQMLGREHIMGVAIGNELEILWQKADSNFPIGSCPDTTSSRACGKHACILNLWHRGGFWWKFQQRVNRIDQLGFQGVPVTSVFGGTAMAGHLNYSFYERGGARVESFFRNATALYGKDRFVFTFNFYGYFDPTACKDAEDQATCCREVVDNDACFNCDGKGHGFVPANVRTARTKIKNITGDNGWKLWIGETGWSSPISDTLWHVNGNLAHCPLFSSEAAQTAYYSNFLTWDLSNGHDPDHHPEQHVIEPADHVFWFSLRDSKNFKLGEHFGLIPTCQDTKCKIK